MTGFLNIVLLIVETISFIITILFIIFATYEEIMGPVEAGKLLEKLHIPLSYNQALIIGLVFFAILVITHTLRQKLFGKF